MLISLILIFCVILVFVFVSQEIIKTFNITKPMIPPRPKMNNVISGGSSNRGNQNDDDDDEEEEEDDN